MMHQIILSRRLRLSVANDARQVRRMPARTNRPVIRHSVGLLLIANLGTSLAVAASSPNRPLPATPKAVLKELRGQLPQSFDLDVDSPCPGPWAAYPAGGATIRLMVMRYRGVPIVHMMGADFQQNVVWTKVGPTMIRFEAGSTKNIISCVDDHAVMNSLIQEDGTLRETTTRIERSPFPAP